MAWIYLLPVKTKVKMGKNNFSAVAFWIKLVVIFVFCKVSLLEVCDKKEMQGIVSRQVTVGQEKDPVNPLGKWALF